MANRKKQQRVNASTARQQFAELTNSVYRNDARIVIEKSGIPVAALISARDLDRLRRFEEKRERDFAVLDEIAEAFKDVPEDELQREVDKAVAEVRAERRAEERGRRSA